MLPGTLLQKEDFLGGTSAIPLQGTINSAKPVSRPEAGLLSALSLYLMTPYGSASDSIVPHATEKEIENTLCAVDCISACRIDEFYAEIM
jgi:golgi-specific brefeldin A-resistance guanine nucleotide exchange factor 1